MTISSCLCNICCTGGLPTAQNVLDTSDFTQYFDHEKSSTILQLINCKLMEQKVIHLVYCYC